MSDSYRRPRNEYSSHSRDDHTRDRRPDRRSNDRTPARRYRDVDESRSDTRRYGSDRYTRQDDRSRDYAGSRNDRPDRDSSYRNDRERKRDASPRRDDRSLKYSTADRRRDDRDRSKSPRHDPSRTHRQRNDIGDRKSHSTRRSRTPPPAAPSRGSKSNDEKDKVEENKPIASVEEAQYGDAVEELNEADIENDDDYDIADDSMAEMQKLMGFGGFTTTQNKQVEGNNIGAVRKAKKTEYRQYMNRVGGFNRPLSPSA